MRLFLHPEKRQSAQCAAKEKTAGKGEKPGGKNSAHHSEITGSGSCPTYAQKRGGAGVGGADRNAGQSGEKEAHAAG